MMITTRAMYRINNVFSNRVRIILEIYFEDTEIKRFKKEVVSTNWSGAVHEQ